VADEARPVNADGNTEAEKKKAGRPPCDMLAVLSVMLYGYMECVYSSRALAQACRQNINFMRLLNGSAPPSHGIINGFRKHLLGRAMERLGCELVKYLERRGEVRFEQVFIDGTMLEAQANRHIAVEGEYITGAWRFPKNSWGAAFVFQLFRYRRFLRFPRLVGDQRFYSFRVIAFYLKACRHRMYSQHRGDFISPFAVGSVQHGEEAYGKLMENFSRCEDIFHQRFIFGV
jgi:transposase